MKFTDSVAFKNIVNRPSRSVALGIIAMLLSFFVFGGALTVSGLKSGLNSLEDKLGADIMAVPYEATTRNSFQNMFLQGSTGYYYMDRDFLNKISELEGVKQVSEQYYFVTMSASCCSIPVQIIGFDPKSDFTVQPWIKKSCGRDIGDMEIVVGSDLNAFVGDTLTFYGKTIVPLLLVCQLY